MYAASRIFRHTPTGNKGDYHHQGDHQGCPPRFPVQCLPFCQFMVTMRYVQWTLDMFFTCKIDHRVRWRTPNLVTRKYPLQIDFRNCQEIRSSNTLRLVGEREVCREETSLWVAVISRNKVIRTKPDQDHDFLEFSLWNEVCNSWGYMRIRKFWSLRKVSRCYFQFLVMFAAFIFRGDKVSKGRVSVYHESKSFS